MGRGPFVIRSTMHDVKKFCLYNTRHMRDNLPYTDRCSCKATFTMLRSLSMFGTTYLVTSQGTFNSHSE